jgi:hypothetical protein
MSANGIHTQLELDELDLDAPFQRGVVVEHPIAKGGYNEDIEGEIVVSVVNGVYYVVDGKQRVTQKRNALDNGEPVKNSIRAVVFRDKTMREAAELFMTVNRGRKALRPWDTFNALRQTGDKVALTVDRVAKEAGYPVRSQGKTDCLTAVDAAQEVVEHYGAEVLKRTLVIWNALYPGITPYSRFLRGVSGALTTQEAPYANLLKKYGDDYLIRRLQTRAGTTHKHLLAYLAAAKVRDADGNIVADNTNSMWMWGTLHILGKRYFKN